MAFGFDLSRRKTTLFTRMYNRELNGKPCLTPLLSEILSEKNIDVEYRGCVAVQLSYPSYEAVTKTKSTHSFVVESVIQSIKGLFLIQEDEGSLVIAIIR